MAQVTLSTILDRLKKQGLTEAEAMALPLSIGVSDAYTNFGTATLLEDWPRTFTDHETDKIVGARLDGYLNKKMLREPPTKKVTT